MEALRNAKAAAGSFSEIVCAPLSVGQVLKYKIDTRSPEYEFDTGRSFFAAYQLPDTGSPYEIEIRSYFLVTVFFPAVLELNSRHEVTRLVTHPYFSYHDGRNDYRGWIGGSIHFSSKDSGEKYIIILTTSELLRQSIGMCSLGLYFEVIEMGYSPRGCRVHDLSPTGSFRLTARSKG